MLASIANTFTNCFKIPELKSRILFTAAILAVCRLIAFVRIPGLDGVELTKFFEGSAGGGGGGVLVRYEAFTGGAPEHCSDGALGVMPYIRATILIPMPQAGGAPLSTLAGGGGGGGQNG